MWVEVHWIGKTEIFAYLKSLKLTKYVEKKLNFVFIFKTQLSICAFQ